MSEASIKPSQDEALGDFAINNRKAVVMLIILGVLLLPFVAIFSVTAIFGVDWNGRGISALLLALVLCALGVLVRTIVRTPYRVIFGDSVEGRYVFGHNSTPWNDIEAITVIYRKFRPRGVVATVLDEVFPQEAEVLLDIARRNQYRIRSNIDASHLNALAQVCTVHGIECRVERQSL
jgi:hypothetical protein